jgi:hypothetical protein
MAICYMGRVGMELKASRLARSHLQLLPQNIGASGDEIYGCNVTYPVRLEGTKWDGAVWCLGWCRRFRRNIFWSLRSSCDLYKMPILPLLFMIHS